jgi:hypothetical protein
MPAGFARAHEAARQERMSAQAKRRIADGRDRARRLSIRTRKEGRRRPSPGTSAALDGPSLQLHGLHHVADGCAVLFFLFLLNDHDQIAALGER